MLFQNCKLASQYDCGPRRKRVQIWSFYSSLFCWMYCIFSFWPRIHERKDCYRMRNQNYNLFYGVASFLCGQRFSDDNLRAKSPFTLVSVPEIICAKSSRDPQKNKKYSLSKNVNKYKKKREHKHIY